MKLLKFILSLGGDKLTYIDVLADLRTISVAALVVGGVSRFFGVHDHTNVIIMSFMTWISCIILIHILRKLVK